MSFAYDFQAMIAAAHAATAGARTPANDAVDLAGGYVLLVDNLIRSVAGADREACSAIVRTVAGASLEASPRGADILRRAPQLRSAEAMNLRVLTARCVACPTRCADALA